MILLDTHVVLWLAFDHSKISKAATSAIRSARQRGESLAISDITLLEIATLHRKGRLTLLGTIETFLTETEARFVILPMTARVCVRAMGFSAPYPADPADRIIGATALVQGLSLLTADAAIRESGMLTTIW